MNIPILSTFAQTWTDEMFGVDSLWNNYGADAIVRDLYNYNNNILYIGGSIRCVNNDTVNDILSWNTSFPSGYQEGVESGYVTSIICYKDTLYIGGTFLSASSYPNTARLAVWNGNNWQSTTIGQADGEVRDFCIYHDTLFVAGNFGHIGSLACDKIAAYTGEHWVNVGSFGMYCRALAVFNDELYAGGYWGVRKYLGGSSWQTFPVVPNGQVNELMVDTINSILFVGGQFTHVNNEISQGCAAWDGFNWIPMGNYYSNTVFSQTSAMYRGELYLANGISYHDDRYDIFIKKWNGQSWDSIGGNFNDNPTALEVFRDTLYIGGGFTYWGGDSPIPTHRSKGLVKLYMPDNGCDYLKPRINTYADTFYLNGGEVDVNLYNNNPYVDSWEWDFGTSTGSVPLSQAVEHTYTEVGEYNVQVTVTDGECVKTANKTIYIELGNEVLEFEQIDMQIFPNPTSHDFIVKTSIPNYQNAEIKIAGLNGHLRSVIPVTGETTIIPTKGWKPGVYVCNLFVEGKLVKVEKLVFE